MLRDIAKKDQMWDGPLGVEAGVFNEIRRLSNVIVPDGGPAALDEKDNVQAPDVWRAPGWKTITLHEALSRKLIDDEDREVVENAGPIHRCPARGAGSILQTPLRLSDKRLLPSVVATVSAPRADSQDPQRSVATPRGLGTHLGTARRMYDKYIA
jgi:hypothetical protein